MTGANVFGIPVATAPKGILASIREGTLSAGDLFYLQRRGIREKGAAPSGRLFA